VNSVVIPVEQIAHAIRVIRGEKVMLDADLADLYGVSTKRLNEQVRRNGRRFPRDFMFRLSPAEARVLRSQFATSSRQHGGRRSRPFVFTEHGAIMLASVLDSEVAVQGSIQVVRAFVRARRLLVSHADLARKLSAMESKYDAQFKVVFDAIRELMSPHVRAPRRIGFRPDGGPEAPASPREAGRISGRRRPAAPSRRAPSVARFCHRISNSRH
jgi:hypothetical protein